MIRTKLTAVIVLAAAAAPAAAQLPPVHDESVTPASGFRHRVAPLFCPRPSPYYPECPPIDPGTPSDPTMPPVTPPPDLSGLTTPFATQTGAGGLQGRSFNESFDGDFGGVFYCKDVQVTRIVRQQVGTRQVPRIIFVDGVPTTILVTVPVFGDVPVLTTQEALVPVAGRYQGISITDNDSPRPTDRIYFNYGYYDGLNAQMNPGIGNITMNRPVFGFEKTFSRGNASIGMRLPFVQINGPVGAAADSVGDLSILTKFAFINNPNGDVVSAGLILTLPTAADGGVLCDGGEIPHSVLFQPWAGFVRVNPRFYVQGITALIVPSDSRDISLWSNSLGIGYWLYRADGDRFINGVIPVAEIHVRTPLNHRDRNGTVYMPDMLNVTGGLHVRFPRATLGGGVCVPTLAPRPWNVEGIASFSYYF